MSTVDFAPVRAKIQALMLECALPSVSVCVAQHGETVWEESFGWADRARRILATPHTLYSLASISKPITATAIMILKERGKLELDRPINNYLGEAKLQARVGESAEATVRRVANHTSGLPLHYQFFYADQPYARPPMDETIRRYGNLYNPPGEECQYSNLGYGLLDYVIERLSGRSYTDFMRTEVFLPLGMTRACVDIAPELEPYAATRYAFDGSAYPFYDFDHPGASAVFCSAHDLVRFGMFHLKQPQADQRAILSDAALDEMQVPVAAPLSSFGVGWAINEDLRGYRCVSHNGGMGGVSTSLHLIPSDGIVVAVLASGNHDRFYSIHDDILAAMLPDYAAPREADKAKMPTESSAAEPVTPQLAADLASEWAGTVHTYNGDLPLTLLFQPDGDVHLQLGTQPRTLLNDVKFRDGRLKGFFAGTIGTEDANRRAYRLHLDLKLRMDYLNGATLAVTHRDGEDGGTPARRMGNALAHWTALRKQSPVD
jgi:CubicO group peptidase (beta-lactamase class C family)